MDKDPVIQAVRRLRPSPPVKQVDTAQQRDASPVHGWRLLAVAKSSTLSYPTVSNLPPQLSELQMRVQLAARLATPHDVVRAGDSAKISFSDGTSKLSRVSSTVVPSASSSPLFPPELGRPHIVAQDVQLHGTASADLDATYKMPNVTFLDTRQVYPLESVICAVNAAHSCTRAGCAINAMGGRVRRERETMPYHQPVLAHTASTHYLVNAAFRPSADILRDLYTTPTAPSLLEIGQTKKLRRGGSGEMQVEQRRVRWLVEGVDADEVADVGLGAKEDAGGESEEGEEDEEGIDSRSEVITLFPAARMSIESILIIVVT
ncbi:hypothetical protein JCM10296v2_007769 [Rhodotorula toruloides]